jgi:hypothetical protein
MSVFISMFFLIPAGSSLAAYTQQASSPSLFKSSGILPVNSSTNAVEGPAVDKTGISPDIGKSVKISFEIPFYF